MVSVSYGLLLLTFPRPLTNHDLAASFVTVVPLFRQSSSSHPTRHLPLAPVKLPEPELSSAHWTDRPVFLRMDWVAFRTCFEDGRTSDESRGKWRRANWWVHSGADQCQARGHKAFSPKRWPRADPLSPLLASIQNEILLKNRFKNQWVTGDEGPCSESPDERPPDVGNLSAERVEEPAIGRCASEDQSLWRMTKTVMRVRLPHPLHSAWSISCLRSRENGSRGLQCWGIFSAGERPVGTGSNWNG
jgi:hypothetical protein